MKTIAALRVDFGVLKSGVSVSPGFGLGNADFDARLGGALRCGCLHEIISSEIVDQGALSGFALLLAQRAAPERPLLWLREDRGVRECGQAYAPGFAELGIDPARVTLTCARNEAALLKAALDIVRCDGVGAVIVEAWGRSARLDLTATRRLALAAERSGVTMLLARVAADPGSSAARTRWRVAAAPSTPLEGDAPGHPAFAVELLRDRGGCPPFSTRLEWDRDRLAFREAPLSGGVAAVPAGRAAARAA